MTTDTVYVFKGFGSKTLILTKSVEEAIRIWRRVNKVPKDIEPDTIECLGQAYTRDDE